MSNSRFATGNRDRNEKEITALLSRVRVPYCLMPLEAGFDILVFVPHVELWEIKNPTRKWTLTKAEHEKKSFCRIHNIPYRIIETAQQAADAISERNTK